MPFVECGISLVALKIRVGRFPRGWKIHHMSQWVPYAFVTPLNVIFNTTHLYSGIWIHWGNS